MSVGFPIMVSMRAAKIESPMTLGFGADD